MSEQAHRQSTAETQLSLLPPAIVEEPQSRRAWPRYLFVVGLVIGTAALAIWLDPFRSPPPAAVEQAKAVAAPPVKAATVEAPAPVPVQATQPPPSEPVPVAAAAGSRGLPTKPTSTAATRSPSSAPAAPHPVAKTGPAKEPATTDGLPASVQQQLPPLVLSGHLRDGNNRLVIVNDKVMREGDEVAPGLTIEKIADDGVVFAFKGHRFRR